MNRELKAKLKDDFPSIFRDCPLVECGDGWHDLIRKLCDDITLADPKGECKALQIKEKFGTLRFYATGGDDSGKIFKMIGEAEVESGFICEDCGTRENVETKAKPGKTWIFTLCEPCRNIPNENSLVCDAGPSC